MRRKNHTAVKKHFACLMSLVLAVGLMPGIALADESYPDVTTPVYAGAEPGQTPVVDVGNVTVDASDPSNEFAVYSHARNDTDTTANAHGSVVMEGTTSRGGTAAWARSTGGTATIGVMGDVTANIDFEGDTHPEFFGLETSSEGEGTNTIANIDGNIVARTTKSDDNKTSMAATGVAQMVATDAGDQLASSQIVVGGNVTAEAKTKSGVTVSQAYGVSAAADNSSEASTTILGSVTAKGATAYGVEADTNASNSNPGSEMIPKTTIMIGRDITAESNSNNGQAFGIGSENTNGSATVYIGGDVTAKAPDGTAIGISGSASNATVDILIEGTLTARTVGVTRIIKDGQVDVTVWRIDSDMVGGRSAGPFKYEEDVPTEKAINYIIKVEQPQEGNILKLVGTTVKQFTTLDGDRSFDVANMDQKVYLDVEDGWIITAAFNGKGDKVALEKDDKGWFVIVPNGGGVYLSAQVAKVEPEPTPTPTPTPTPAPSYVSGNNGGYLPATGDSPIGIMVLAFAAAAGLALALVAASRLNGCRHQQ